MFFIGIFGIENKSAEIKILNNLICERCKQIVKAKLILKLDFFHFFYIPIFKWNVEYYVQCERCNAIYTISKEKGRAIENNEEVQMTYWDLKDAFNDIYYNSKCLNCGREVDRQYSYCPYCGEKIK
ncbi:zinc ribbon domain-containing protein [Clostridium neonatale]|uniref:zinc ribbon domain-containing protein n=1 Tax=Clostridium neonatale TaxID=137838 RepID=UPI00291B68A2|nr:zinc ribbon domain-containing protein [Clostridium neonatale]CAI3196223.1 Conserved hypothetical protein [Clostridium neonatale]